MKKNGSIFNFIRNCQNFPQSVGSILHFKFPISSSSFFSCPFILIVFFFKRCRLLQFITKQFRLHAKTILYTQDNFKCCLTGQLLCLLSPEKEMGVISYFLGTSYGTKCVCVFLIYMLKEYLKPTQYVRR